MVSVVVVVIVVVIIIAFILLTIAKNCGFKSIHLNSRPRQHNTHNQNQSHQLDIYESGLVQRL